MSLLQVTPSGALPVSPLSRVKHAVQQLGYLPPSESMALQMEFGIAESQLEAMEERFRYEKESA